MSDLTPLEAAEKLEIMARHRQDWGDMPEAYALRKAASYLRKIASGEYAPVVHAKSIFVNNGKVERWCSRCNHIIPKYAEWCPFCGALMDGKDGSPS